MGMKRIPIDEASPAQLREFLTVIKGVDANPNCNTGQLLAKIEAVEPGIKEVIVTDSEAPAPAPQAYRPALTPDGLIKAVNQHLSRLTAEQYREKERAYRLNPDMGENGKPVMFSRRHLPSETGHGYHTAPIVKIIIPISPEPGGERDVPAAHNGVQCLVKRNIEVDVPYPIFLSLAEAKQMKYEQIPATNPGEHPVTIERESLSYAFNVLANPPPEEIAQWLALTADAFAP
jgi:hypothetical protein